MSEEWLEYPLSEVIDIKHGFAYKGEFFCEEDTGEIILTLGNFRIGGGFKDDKFKFYKGPIVDDYILNKNDLLITMTDLSKAADTLGYPSLVPNTEGYRFHHNQRLGLVKIIDTNKFDKYFIYYLLSTSKYHQEIVASATGTTVKHTSPSRIRQYRARIPDLETQRQIAATLKNLDDRITLNRTLNETLEEMSRALFQSWFVDFDPVKAKLAAKRHGRDPERACMAAISGKLRIPAGKPGAERLDDQLPTADGFDAAITALDTLTEAQRQQLAETATHFPSDFQESELGLIPTGWDTKTFSEIFEINPRRALRKNTIAPYLDMKSVPTSGPSPEGVIQREFKSGTKFINGDTLLARITPCLENGKTAFVDFLKDGEVGWGSTEFIVIRPKNISSSIGYFYARSGELRTHAINNMSGTSGRQRVPAECFNNFLIPSPEDYLLYEEFGRIAQAVLNSIRSDSDQSRTLTELRDTLLPKLLNGELSVSAAEDAVEKAAEPC